jgi:hypothetical protein
MHPVDTLKTLKMSNRGGNNDDNEDAGAPMAAATAAMGPGAVSPVSFEASDVAASEDGSRVKLPSFGALYKGLPAALLKEGPPSALYLGIYETIKTALLPNGGVFSAAASPAAPPSGGATAADHALLLAPLVVYLVAGAAGELVGSAVRAPSEAAKTRVQSGLAATTAEAFGQLARQPQATLATWQTSLLRDVPFGAIQIALFECTKTAILQSPDIDFDVNTLAAEALLGGLGGAVGSFLTTPADVLITRLITQPEYSSEAKGSGEEGGDVEVFARLTPLEMAQRIYAEGGVGAYFTGAAGRVGYWAPAIAIFLSLYCRLRGLGLEVFPQL